MSCDGCMEHSAIVGDIETLKKDMAEMKTKHAIMSESHVENRVRLDMVITTLNGLVNDVKCLASLPASRWNSLVMILIGAAVGAIIGVLASKFK